MSGIAAIYAYAPSASAVDPDELRAISKHMAARGPDGRGEWFSDNLKVALAHRRLATIDLSDQATQPMASEDGRLVISFDGAVYNYRELREDLIGKGHTFRTDSDTEVLLTLYSEKGEEMVHDLRGMYAFALWDADKEAILLVRDPFGIKPLYYADDGQSIRIASQVKSLLAGGKIDKEIDPAGVVGFHLLGSVPEPFTTYKSITELRAGSTMWINRDGVQEPGKYCSISQVWAAAEKHPQKSRDIESDIREALIDSVRHHLVSDVPIAVFLSAGIESGALLGLIRELNPDTEIRTITLRFNEYKGRPQDESVLAEAVARHYGAKHTTRLVTNEELDEDLPIIVEAMDQPTIDGINCWFVSKAAKELGIKVAISGFGGDELFGGYSSFEDIPRWTRSYSVPSKVPFLGDMTKAFGYLLLGNSADPKSLGLIKYGGNYASAWLLRRGVYLPYELKSVLPSRCVNEGLKRLQPMKHIQAAMGEGITKPYPRISAMESSLYMRNQLLRDSDWAGMAHSLEIRSPLVDCTLLRRLAPLLIAEERIEGRKWVGNAPATRLPDEVLKREKTCFTTPMEKWLRKRYEERREGCRYRPNEHWTRGWAQSLANYLEII